MKLPVVSSSTGFSKSNIPVNVRKFIGIVVICIIVFTEILVKLIQVADIQLVESIFGSEIVVGFIFWPENDPKMIVFWPKIYFSNLFARKLILDTSSCYLLPVIWNYRGGGRLKRHTTFKVVLQRGDMILRSTVCLDTCNQCSYSCNIDNGPYFVLFRKYDR